MLIDGFGRKVDYLRVSVTERCNFRCQYCMPEKPFSWVPRENLLSYEDLFKFIKASIDEGIKKVRITGGEPLLREDLDFFIKIRFLRVVFKIFCKKIFYLHNKKILIFFDTFYLTQERILLAGFSACGGSLQRHDSSPTQCDPARRAFYVIGTLRSNFL